MTDSNHRPAVYETTALPSELIQLIAADDPLRRRVKKGEESMPGQSPVAGVAGFEPAHEGVKVPCLTTWLYPNMNRYS